MQRTIDVERIEVDSEWFGQETRSFSINTSLGDGLESLGHWVSLMVLA